MKWLDYEFIVYDRDGTNWNDVPGNYLFCRWFNSEWHVLYAGETGSFKKRPLGPGHEKWDGAVHAGMTHIHARREDGPEATRQKIEMEIRLAFDPPLNRQ